MTIEVKAAIAYALLIDSMYSFTMVICYRIQTPS